MFWGGGKGCAGAVATLEQRRGEEAALMPCLLLRSYARGRLALAGLGLQNSNTLYSRMNWMDLGRRRAHTIVYSLPLGLA